MHSVSFVINFRFNTIAGHGHWHHPQHSASSRQTTFPHHTSPRHHNYQHHSPNTHGHFVYPPSTGASHPGSHHHLPSSPGPHHIPGSPRAHHIPGSPRAHHMPSSSMSVLNTTGHYSLASQHSPGGTGIYSSTQPSNPPLG